jgi:paired small multidrug resistance pump
LRWSIAVTLPDIGGLIGVAMMLAAYALSASSRIRVDAWPALTANLIGAGLVLVSLMFKFNLPAFIMESAWGLVALSGLARLVLKNRR